MRGRWGYLNGSPNNGGDTLEPYLADESCTYLIIVRIIEMIFSLICNCRSRGHLQMPST